MNSIKYFKDVTEEMGCPRIFGDPERVQVATTAALGNVFINPNGGMVYIEDYVMITHDVKLITGWHDYQLRDRARMESDANMKRPITIKRGAMIGSGAIILGPVTIGEYAVVAAGAVVTHDVPPWTMVGGIPAKIIKHIEEHI